MQREDVMGFTKIGEKFNIWLQGQESCFEEFEIEAYQVDVLRGKIWSLGQAILEYKAIIAIVKS